MSKTQQFLMLVAAAGLGSLVPQAFGTAAEAQQPVTQFGEINVRRLNIVEPNGRYRLVLSNSERFPGLFMEGKEYRHHSRTGGGMLFFNDEGDEVGGLTFRSTPANKSASAGIMFDQYKQDQTVGIQYSETQGNRVAGLRVWDRPDYSIAPLMQMSDRVARAANDQERQRLRAEMQTFVASKGGAGAERMFVGKNQKDAIVRLADTQGRTRLQLRVDAAGQPSIEFLDEKGAVTRRISQ